MLSFYCSTSVVSGGSPSHRTGKVKNTQRVIIQSPRDSSSEPNSDFGNDTHHTDDDDDDDDDDDNDSADGRSPKTRTRTGEGPSSSHAEMAIPPSIPKPRPIKLVKCGALLTLRMGDLLAGLTNGNIGEVDNDVAMEGRKTLPALKMMRGKKAVIEPSARTTQSRKLYNECRIASVTEYDGERMVIFRNSTKNYENILGDPQSRETAPNYWMMIATGHYRVFKWTRHGMDKCAVKCDQADAMSEGPMHRILIRSGSDMCESASHMCAYVSGVDMSMEIRGFEPNAATIATPGKPGGLVDHIEPEVNDLPPDHWMTQNMILGHQPAQDLIDLRMSGKLIRGSLNLTVAGEFMFCDELIIDNFEVEHKAPAIAKIDTSLTGLKEITAKIMAIVTGTRQLPPGHSHFSLTTQADAVWQYGSGPYLPGLVWPNWHSIGYNDTHLLMHPWHSKVLAWEELGDHTFDLLVVSGPSVGPIPVDLPPSPVITGPSTNPASESQEKGKGKAVVPDPEPEVEGSRKRKSPMILALPSQPPKSTMKTWKRAKTTGLAKFKVFVESEDEEDSVTQPISCGVPEVVLPRLSPDVARTSGSPRSPRSPKKKPFGPAMAIAGKCPEVIEPPQATPEPPVEAPPVIDAGDILIPGPNNPCQACHKMEWPCATRFDKRTGAPCMSCVYCTTKKIKCISSQSRVSSVTPSPSGAQTPKVQIRGRSKTVTAAKEPTPAPALPSSTSRVPRSALNVPMPDLHAMAMAIWEGLRREIILQHPTFPLPDAQGDATSFLLHQPIPPAMSTPASALPPLIDLSMEGMEPNPPSLQDESVIDGLIFELNQIHPEVSQMPGKIVKLDDLGNLLPEYDSVEEMDVQVKGEPSVIDVYAMFSINVTFVIIDLLIHRVPSRGLVATSFEVFDSGGVWKMLIGNPLLEQLSAVHDYATDQISLPSSPIPVIITNMYNTWANKQYVFELTPQVTQHQLDAYTTALSNAGAHIVVANKRPVISMATTPLSDTPCSPVSFPPESTPNTQDDKENNVWQVHVDTNEVLGEIPDFPKSTQTTNVFTRHLDPFKLERVAEVMRSITIGEDLSEEQRQQVHALCEEFADTFALAVSEVYPVTFKTFKLTFPEGTTFSTKLEVAGIIWRIAPEDVKAASPTVLAQKVHDSEGPSFEELLHQVNDQC
ncbi:uncharacterized protein EDB93DRAFT_1298964 [Suillus bovinus]|uniref:uncharacterized protein n=1 Tax=Suillus bovinus TaxID=48563 RepID=UPI001B86E24B|nr:uncharacterized protein EDB93DRAFT_1298964 [Suillus bovinus]KAG2139099.1 hypothetical protein EDB93DRAFT_1298964 [Suillus bovinus]